MTSKSEEILNKVLMCLRAMGNITTKHQGDSTLLLKERKLFGVVDSGLLYFRSDDNVDKTFSYNGRAKNFSLVENIEELIVYDEHEDKTYSDELLKMATQAYWLA